LQNAALQALKLRRSDCRDFTLNRSWRACALTLLNNLILAHS
jgi:hypothetical protein